MTKIAILKLSSLGDIIHALACVEQIPQGYEIYWIVDSSFSGVLKNQQNINEVPLPIRELKKSKSLSLLKKTFTTLKELPFFDIVIDMQGLIKSALISRLLKSKEVWGFDKNSSKEHLAAYFYTHKVSIPYSEHILRRNCTLLSSALNEDIDPKNITTPFLYAKKNEAEDGVLISFGSSKRDKIYPKERIVELVELIDKDVYLIAYTDEEMEYAKFISANSKAKLLPKMSLEELVEKIAGFRFLVGVDSGVSYISWALGVRTIMLFGPTNPKRFAPECDSVVIIDAKSMQEINPEKIASRIE
ncbi:MAG: lipopolysaccharide heptosyltransferase I [Campylobacterales bacterium]